MYRVDELIRGYPEQNDHAQRWTLTQLEDLAHGADAAIALGFLAGATVRTSGVLAGQALASCLALMPRQRMYGFTADPAPVAGFPLLRPQDVAWSGSLPPLRQVGIALAADGALVRQLEDKLLEKEMADYLVFACAVDPVARKVIGRDLPENPGEADFDNLYQYLRGQLDQLIFSVQGDLLVRMHADVTIEHRRRGEKAREDYRTFGKEFARDLADTTTKKLRDAGALVKEELDEINGLFAAPAGDELKTANPDLHRFLIERNDGLDTVLPTYQNIAESLKEAADAAQRQP